MRPNRSFLLMATVLVLAASALGWTDSLSAGRPVATASATKPAVEPPAVPAMTVTFRIDWRKIDNGSPAPAPVLTIRNNTTSAITVLDPRDRYGLTLVVLDQYGNFITLKGLRKVDPAYGKLAVPAGTTMETSLGGFAFLTGTGEFSYQDFKTGETYRVLAIYRPEGLQGPTVCSQDVTFIAP